jgi:serine/threonine-protein phosphatase PGAM5
MELCMGLCVGVCVRVGVVCEEADLGCHDDEVLGGYEGYKGYEAGRALRVIHRVLGGEGSVGERMRCSGVGERVWVKIDLSMIASAGITLRIVDALNTRPPPHLPLMFRQLSRPAGTLFAASATLLSSSYLSTSSCDDPPSSPEEMYYNFPASEKFTPKLPYPLTDGNWDGKDDEMKAARILGKKFNVPVPSVTRHVILVRHGQYDETHREDELRLLTPLGRRQAELTGARLAHMIGSDKESHNGCVKVKVVHVSDMARAKETADIIVDAIKQKTGIDLPRTEPNPDLNEGRPCHIIPSSRPFSSKSIERDSGRIERAFNKYFYRHVPVVEEPKEAKEERRRKEKLRRDFDLSRPSGAVDKPFSGKAWWIPEDHEAHVDNIKKNKNKAENGDVGKDAGKKKAEDDNGPAVDATVAEVKHEHEYEIIVCHGNVIRYFFMRALQLPPEAWLRLCTFNCSLTYFTIRSGGGVSCRMLGDIGHLDMDHTTFSGHHGFNW